MDTRNYSIFNDIPCNSNVYVHSMNDGNYLLDKRYIIQSNLYKLNNNNILVLNMKTIDLNDDSIDIDIEANKLTTPYIYWYNSGNNIILYINIVGSIRTDDIKMEPNHICIKSGRYYMDFDLYDRLYNISYRFVENFAVIIGTKTNEQLVWKTLSKHNDYPNHIIYDGNYKYITIKYMCCCIVWVAIAFTFSIAIVAFI
jgi:hypothetical protein